MTTHSPDSTPVGGPQDDDRAVASDSPPAAHADRADAPRPDAADDVRIGPDQSDEPQAGAAEPAD